MSLERSRELLNEYGDVVLSTIYGARRMHGNWPSAEVVRDSLLPDELSLRDRNLLMVALLTEEEIVKQQDGTVMVRSIPFLGIAMDLYELYPLYERDGITKVPVSKAKLVDDQYFHKLGRIADQLRYVVNGVNHGKRDSRFGAI